MEGYKCEVCGKEMTKEQYEASNLGICSYCITYPPLPTYRILDKGEKPVCELCGGDLLEYAVAGGMSGAFCPHCDPTNPVLINSDLFKEDGFMRSVINKLNRIIELLEGQGKRVKDTKR